MGEKHIFDFLSEGVLQSHCPLNDRAEGMKMPRLKIHPFVPNSVYKSHLYKGIQAQALFVLKK